MSEATAVPTTEPQPLPNFFYSFWRFLLVYGEVEKPDDDDGNVRERLRRRHERLTLPSSLRRR